MPTPSTNNERSVLAGFLGLALLACAPVFSLPAHADEAPSEAPSSVASRDGFSVVPILADPDIASPVDFAFDEDGRLWVAEFRGTVSPAGAPVPTGRISVHKDKDADGVYETHAVFLDDILLPESLQFAGGGVLFSSGKTMYFAPRKGGLKAGDPSVLDENHTAGDIYSYGGGKWWKRTSGGEKPSLSPSDDAALRGATDPRFHCAAERGGPGHGRYFADNGKGEPTYGRIWHMTPKTSGTPAGPPKMSGQKSADIAVFLASDNPWWRATAQRMLRERGEAAASAAPKDGDADAAATPLVSGPPSDAIARVPMSPGQAKFQQVCAACHGPKGEGLAALAPPLAGSAWVQGPRRRAANILLAGLAGPIVVKGHLYQPPETAPLMPPLGSTLSDGEIADILSFVRTSFGNQASPVSAADVAAARRMNRSTPWTAKELRETPPGPGEHENIAAPSIVVVGVSCPGFLTTVAGRVAVLAAGLMVLLVALPMVAIRFLLPRQ